MLEKIGKSLLKMLAKNGVISGPYYFKGIWFAKKEASQMLDSICGADERRKLSEKYQKATVGDAERLVAFIEEA